MTALALASVVALATTAAAGPVSIAAPGLTTVQVEPRLGEVYLDRLISLLRASGPLKVTSSRDIEQVLGLDRQRQLLGCDESSCLTELVGALGVDAILTGSLASTGSGFLVTIRVLRASNGSDLVTVSQRLPDEARLGEWLEAQAPEIARRVLLGFGRVEEAAAIARPASALVRWTPGIVGGLAALGGGVCFALAASSASTLKDPSVVDVQTIQRAGETGRTTQTLGPLLVGVGLAGVATSVVWSLVAASSSTTVAVVPGRDGLGLAVGGRF